MIRLFPDLDGRRQSSEARTPKLCLIRLSYEKGIGLIYSLSIKLFLLSTDRTNLQPPDVYPAIKICFIVN